MKKRMALLSLLFAMVLPAFAQFDLTIHSFRKALYYSFS